MSASYCIIFVLLCRRFLLMIQRMTLFGINRVCVLVIQVYSLIFGSSQGTQTVLEDATGARQKAGPKVQQTKVGSCTSVHIHIHTHAHQH